ncbi:hypothetical protein N7452_006256 [Penicillium brevicompactum]|uniref:Uncharacterized protein n=2 Tax=Penicillium brevicompactum TaxID=5074 RepID=A0A9W9UFU1_PENBR|nr:hypothetical protein N7452_006256 [Penicillium brevicompactum]
MRGDAYDLSSILAWASFFWEDNVEQPLDYPKWSPEFKAAVKVASKKLAKSFEACEKTHRIAHKLIRDKGETPEACIRISEYHQFIMERYTLYPNPIKQPETRAGKAEWDAFNCEQGQRLRDGDPGHMAWAVAKQVFYDSVQRALLEMPLLNAEALSVLQEDFAKSFPVTLHSI